MSLASLNHIPPAKKTASGGRGKVAEGLVNTWLKAWGEKHLHFTYNRILDAGSAGGRFVSQPGDFQAFGWGRNWLLEVKETQHSFRLNHGNFNEDQVARMRKRELAGSHCIVLVYHAAEKVWRAPPFTVFKERTGGSWVLTEWPTKSLREILLSELAPKVTL